jgi:hypothetical protein
MADSIGELSFESLTATIWLCDKYYNFRHLVCVQTDMVLKLHALKIRHIHLKKRTNWTPSNTQTPTHSIRMFLPENAGQ